MMKKLVRYLFLLTLYLSYILITYNRDIMKRLLLLFIFLDFFQISYSQGRKGFQALITHENDIFAPLNRDENYTGGLKIDVMTPTIFKSLNKSGKTLNIHRFGVGGTGYTPQALDSVNIVYGDRPYASIVFFNLGNIFYNLESGFTLKNNLYIGTMGTDGPGNLQSWLHRVGAAGSTRPIPLGWNNQIAYNESKFVLNFNTQISQLIGGDSGKIILGQKFHYVDVRGIANINLGNYMSNFEGGLRLNLFNFNSSILSGYSPDIPLMDGNGCSNFRANLFVEPIIRYSIFNATLEGSMFNDSSVYTIAPSRVQRVLFDFKTGINMTIYNSIYLRYSLHGRSQEFIDGKKFHLWGAVTIGYSLKNWFCKKQ